MDDSLVFSRLNLTPSTKRKLSSSDTPLRGTPLRGMKRKRAVIEDTSKSAFKSTSRAMGDIEIIDECPEGRFIRLENKNKKVTFYSFFLSLSFIL